MVFGRGHVIVLGLGRCFLLVGSCFEFGHVLGLRLGRELQPGPGRLALGLGSDLGPGLGLGLGGGLGLSFVLWGWAWACAWAWAGFCFARAWA